MKVTDPDDRHINVPSWSLPISLIVEVSDMAEQSETSQSSIVKRALEKELKAMKDEKDTL